MSDKIKEFISGEMEGLQMNDRQFKEYLNEKLSAESDTYIRSHVTVVNMRAHGKAPSTDLLEDMLCVYPVRDRRFRIALRLLALKSPHVWGLGGLVWGLKNDSLLPSAE